MKKIIPAIAIAGTVAAFVIYKMKKEQQKKNVISLDEGLLEDDGLNDEIEEGPISDPASCCEAFEEAVTEGREMVKESAEHLKKEASDLKDDVKEHLEEAGACITDEFQKIKAKSKELMNNMMEQGDVQEHERPVQHHVQFNTKEDLEGFKEEIINKGYVITQGDHELELNVLHISPMKEDKLMKNVQDIVDCANTHNGKYVNWTSKIVY